MGLAGLGAVAIWHDIAPEGRAEFYAWHGREHMPERAAIPGFLRGRRYVAIEGAPEFFNLYETESAATLVGPDYLARLNAPTPWTVATVKHFRNVARSLCSVAGSAGQCQGGLMATFQYAIPDGLSEAHIARLNATIIPGIAARPGVAGCHLLVADEAASAVETVEKKVRAERNLIPRWALLVEGWGDAQPFVDLARCLLTDGTFVDASGPALMATYRLQNTRSR